MAILRLAIMALVVLTVIYFSVSFWSRAVRRDKLERQWAEEGRIGDREAYVKEGLAEYDGSFKRRLILAVYVIPGVVVGLIVYLVNYN